jgi:hypothetical protein
MDLKKVIFVDADQIVRTDLKELVDLDLQGAPYGYTPMGKLFESCAVHWLNQRIVIYR